METMLKPAALNSHALLEDRAIADRLLERNDSLCREAGRRIHSLLGQQPPAEMPAFWRGVLAAVTAMLLIGMLLAYGCGRAAQAQTRPETLARHGNWHVYVSRADGNGPLMCGMDASNDRSMFMLKWVAGSDHMQIQAMSSGWRIPSGTMVPVSMQIDGHSPWTATARAQDNRMLAWRASGAEVEPFLLQFVGGRNLVLFFPEGRNELPWRISLLGSGQALVTFTECMRAVGRTSSQPYGGGRSPAPAPAPSQPFGGGGRSL